MASSNSEIEQRLRTKGASLVGFADVSGLPVSTTGGLPRAVSVAVRLASTIACG
ncbi:MAG: hypothetical protein RBR19_07100 [Sedimentisphaerales bacterium]|nr:hypothetical protein [Sedimentisphaerales bacterium]